MISVIVPVYNVEEYLVQCLDSVVGQTYGDLEILLVDDGSTDGSGRICDEYAEKNPRIRVFHTVNHGLSAARNIGLDRASGEYIAFVDSDDWLETDMYERMIEAAEMSGADIVVCGYFIDKPDIKEKKTLAPVSLDKEEALTAVIHGKVPIHVWGRLFSLSCFSRVRFPVGYDYEDTIVTYSILNTMNRMQCIEPALYHYRIRENSITKQNTPKNLRDHWRAVKGAWDMHAQIVGMEEKKILFSRCAFVIIRTWRWYYRTPKEERKSFDISRELQEMSRFARENFTLSRTKSYPVSWRIGLLLARYNKSWSFALSHFMQFLSEAKPRNDK